MAGHSKWANIKHRKARQDAQRGKIFTKLIRELTVAAKEGGGLVEDNPRLRLAVDKALGANMTRDTIDRAIARGAGTNEADNVEELSYEGYGVSGVAVYVEAMTDNRNRTAAEVRHAFDKYGGNLGQSGSVMFMFNRQGIILIEKDGVDEDKLMEAALEAGAVDFLTDDDIFDVRTEPNDLGAIRDDLEAAGYKYVSAEVEYVPTTYTALTDPDDIKNMGKMLEMFEENDDVQDVWHNWENEDDYE